MPQIEEGGMEHDGCCFLTGTGAAGRDHLFGAGAAAVRTAFMGGDADSSGAGDDLVSKV